MTLHRWPFSSAKALVASLAVLLLALSLWQGVDSVVRLYGGADQEIAMMDRSRALAAADLLERADDWLWDPQARIRAGLLRFRFSVLSQPGILPDPVARAQSMADLSDGLARAPADARGWTALAHAQLIAGDMAKGKLAFRVALLTALYDPSLMLWRCQLGLALWPLLDSEDQGLVANQLRMAWVDQAEGLLELAKSGRNVPVIAAALDQDPPQRTAFEKALRH